VYRNDISDLIAYDPSLIDAQHPFGAPNNVDRARIRGAEGALGASVAGWSLSATATWLDPRDHAHDGSYGKLLPRRARQTARLDADRSFGKLSVGASWFVLRLAYALDRDWKLQLALDNAFDKRYETAWYYNQPGRNFMLTLRYRPAH
jgi:vitamin B12 transporter